MSIIDKLLKDTNRLNVLLAKYFKNPLEVLKHLSSKSATLDSATLREKFVFRDVNNMYSIQAEARTDIRIKLINDKLGNILVPGDTILDFGGNQQIFDNITDVILSVQDFGCTTKFVDSKGVFRVHDNPNYISKYNDMFVPLTLQGDNEFKAMLPESGKYKLIFIESVLHHLNKEVRKHVYRGLHNCLTEGGSIIVSENICNTDIDKAMIFAGHKIHDALVQRSTDLNSDNLLSVDSWMKEWREHGFDVLEINDTNLTYNSSSLPEKTYMLTKRRRDITSFKKLYKASWVDEVDVKEYNDNVDINSTILLDGTSISKALSLIDMGFNVVLPLPLITSVKDITEKLTHGVWIYSNSNHKVKIVADDEKLQSKHMDSIIKLISENEIVGVKAPTGSGKSTYLVDSIAKCLDKTSSIFVVEPTVTSARSLYKYMSDKDKSRKVGFAAEGEVHYNKYDKIVYATSGHIRRKMYSYFENGIVKKSGIDFCDVLMIDEAHSGSLDVEAIIALWKEAALQRVAVPKLLLASATLSKETVPINNVAIYEIDVKGFPVESMFHPRDYALYEYNIYRDTAHVVLKMHRERPLVKPINGWVKTSDNKVSDSWLVFCPGVREIELIYDQLKNEPNMEVLMANGTMKSDEIEKIYTPVKEGIRRIIVATNIAETAITIPNLSGVFNTMTEKYATSSTSGGLRLVVDKASKSSCEQRRGRTGRTCPGFCYHMCTKEAYDNLPVNRPPEIDRIPLHTLVIETLDVGFKPETLYQGRIPQKRVRESTDLLMKLGMIKDSKVTEMGHFAPLFPLSVRSSAILYHWLQTDYPIYPCIITVALMDVYEPSYFWYPRRDKDNMKDYVANMDDYYKEHFSKYGGKSSMESFINMWNLLQKNVKIHSRNHRALAEYCQKESLNNKKITEVINISRQIRNSIMRCISLEGQNAKIVEGPFTAAGVLSAMIPILKNVYSDCTVKHIQDLKYKSNTNHIYELQKNDRNVMPGIKIPKELIVLGSRNVGFKNTVQFYHPLDDELQPIAVSKPKVEAKSLVEEDTDEEDEDEDILAYDFDQPEKRIMIMKMPRTLYPTDVNPTVSLNAKQSPLPVKVPVKQSSDMKLPAMVPVRASPLPMLIPVRYSAGVKRIADPGNPDEIPLLPTESSDV